ncbi:MAG: TetR/AcrR family transcriptional regulator [Actinomycetota bacterium]|nr:TetR/AcrR family transcriptional regulator [Actinomycetota bacterium]
MATVKKRTYTSAIRTQQAARTRSLIIEAAAELFVADGYGATTIRAIAAAAGVAPDTVYATFGSKVRVLTALIDSRLAPTGAPNVMDRDEAMGVRDETDQRRQMHLLALDMAAVSTRVRPVYEVLRTASAIEPEAREVFAEMEQYRLANMRRAVAWLESHGLLREPERAAATLFAIASPDVGRMLCNTLGWSEAEHAAWLEHVLAAALLVPAATSPPRRR